MSTAKVTGTFIASHRCSQLLPPPPRELTILIARAMAGSPDQLLFTSSLSWVAGQLCSPQGLQPLHRWPVQPCPTDSGQHCQLLLESWLGDLGHLKCNTFQVETPSLSPLSLCVNSQSVALPFAPAPTTGLSGLPFCHCFLPLGSCALDVQNVS